MSERAVLLVEDDRNDVLFMRRAWKEAGIRAPLAAVEDGEKALAYLSGTGVYADRSRYPEPSLVLLDLKIPLMSGLEVLRWIRQSSPRPDLPVCVLTSSEEPGDVAQARALGIRDFIVKPSGYSALVEIVRKLGV